MNEVQDMPQSDDEDEEEDEEEEEEEEEPTTIPDEGKEPEEFDETKHLGMMIQTTSRRRKSTPNQSPSRRKIVIPNQATRWDQP
jgi:hypothetical protein